MMKNNTIRTRWAAIGAAVAVTLGAGGIGLVSATSPADAVAYVPIEPCRIADTRSDPAFNVGPRSTPIGADEIHVIAAHGDNGDCTGIPTSATGLQLNVTALNASQNTFVTVWGEGARPNASSLNPALGQPPAPNAVTTGLTATGRFNVFNRFGNVDVVADVVGYYTDHNHDDRYYTETEVDAAVGVKANSDDVYTKTEGDDRYAPISENVEGAIDLINDEAIVLTGTDQVIMSATVDTATSGYVMAEATVRFSGSAADNSIRCSLSTSTLLDPNSIMIQNIDAGDFGTIATTRGFVENKALLIIGGDDNEMTVNVVCDERSGNVTVGEGALTLTFVPDGDAFGFIFLPLDASAADAGPTDGE